MKKVLFAAMFSLLITGCGGSGGASSVDNVSEVNHLNGGWKSNCFEYSDEVDGIWTITTYEFVDNLYSSSSEFFSDDSCSVELDDSTGLFHGSSGTYEKIGRVNTTSGVEVDWFSLNADSANNIELEEQIEVEIGLYISHDALYQVYEENGNYIIVFENPYYRISE